MKALKMQLLRAIAGLFLFTQNFYVDWLTTTGLTETLQLIFL